MQNDDKTFHILALDGGGARGIYSARVLARIEETLGAPVRDCFDLIAGTSAGAISAGAAAIGIPMSEVVDLFKTESARIFRKRWFRQTIIFCNLTPRRRAYPTPHCAWDRRAATSPSLDRAVETDARG